MRRARAAFVAAVLVAAGTVLAFVLRGGSSPDVVAPVDNVAGNFRACLVSSSAGSPSSRAVWAAMQKAAATGRVNAQTFVAPTGAEAAPFLQGVVGVGCNVVVVAEPVLVRAVADVAATAQQQRFLVVGSGSAAGNVEVVGDATAVSGWIGNHAGG